VAIIKKAKYDESSIEALEGLDGVRAKPAFYLGVPPSDLGLYQLAKELVDNGVDEAQNGYGDTVGISVSDKTNEVFVWDHGRGIPVGIHPKFKAQKRSTLEIIFSILHAGGKLFANQTGYAKSRGTHGVGAAVVNALTESLDVYSKRDGQWWYQKFSKGKTISKVTKVSSPPKLPGGQKAPKSGTVIRYVPDMSIFSNKAKLPSKQIQTWFELQAYIHPKINFVVVANGVAQTFYQKNGLVDFLNKKVADYKVEKIGKPFICQTANVDIALQWSTYADEDTKSYINGSPTIDGGTHVTGLNRAITEALKPYATSKKDTFKPEDARFGLLAVLNYSTKSPEFDSQSKSKGVSKAANAQVYEELKAPLAKFFAENKVLAKAIIDKAIEIRKKTSSFLADKKLVQNVKRAKTALSAKLADVNNSKIPFSDRELFLVEGDSAGGTAKVARDKNFQATFSLKGKPLNVMETTKDKVNSNKEIASIFAGIGLDLSVEDPVSKIRFGKIIFLADADVDGRHINTLLLTVFWKYLPELFTRGCIYIVKSPEYMARHKGKLYFGSSKSYIYKKAGTEKLEVQHIKGWGECEPDDLQPMAFKIGSRKLYRVLPPKDKKGKLQFEALMGRDSRYRKKLLGVER
jgi:DNA gyrase/topoisomerase IV subunit B